MVVYATPKPVKEEKAEKKRRGKSPHTKIVNEIDHIDSDIALIKSEFKCLMCGGRASQNHHFFPKGSHGNVRFDPRNHCPLDFACHRRKVHDAGEVEEMRDRLIAKIGQEEFDDLKRLAYVRADFCDRALKAELFYKEKILIAAFDEARQDVKEMLSDAAFARLKKARKNHYVEH
jgi:hypothetical protein